MSTPSLSNYRLANHPVPASRLLTLDPVGNGAMAGAISNIYPEKPKLKQGWKKGLM